MKKAPKVLTRMRLSCCWGDNLNEKELNDVVDYINGLEQEVKKQKEVIDRKKYLLKEQGTELKELYSEIDKLQGRIDKAIEYLETKRIREKAIVDIDVLEGVLKEVSE